MKILLTGGGTGGHFYPAIAVANALNLIADQEKIAKMELIFMAESPYDQDALLQNGVRFKKTYSGKIRRYFSVLNVIDLFKIIPGIIKSILGMYFDFPDVVFSKGGHESFPVVFAARFLGIPVVIHESDAVPGKVNAWAGKFAKRVAIAFPGSSQYFSKKNVALTGNPVRKEFFVRKKEGAKEFFGFEDKIKTVFVTGGSQGAQIINDNLLDVLPELLKGYQIIHQCGKNNLKEVENRVSVLMESSVYKPRYRIYDYLDVNGMRMAYGASDLIVSRAGAASIFEIAASGLPSIIVPLADSAQDHQRENAYAYAKSGAAEVIEQNNLTPHVLRSEIEGLLNNKDKLQKMSEEAKKFSKPDAAEKIAREIIRLAIEHK